MKQDRVSNCETEFVLRRRGRQPSREGVPTYYFPKFSEKLREIEEIFDRRGGAPPLRSATGSSPYLAFRNLKS